MVGAICRHTRRKLTKPPKRKLSSADDNYLPLQTAASVPTSPTEMTTIYPVQYIPLFILAIIYIHLENCYT